MILSLALLFVVSFNQTAFGGLVGARSRKLLLMLKAELPLGICLNQYATLPRWPQGDWNHNLKLTTNLEQLHTNTERNEMFGCETSCICNSPTYKYCRLNEMVEREHVYRNVP